MLPLPTPTRGGSLNQLRAFLNLKDEDGWILAVACLVAAYRPQGPFPIEVLFGEQGSGKTFTARILRSLIDPNLAPLRSEPRTAHDLMIAANNGWVLGFDNLSDLSQALSDDFCRLSTGGAWASENCIRIKMK